MKKNTNLLSYTPVGQKSYPGLIGLKSRCWQVCIPSGNSRVESISSPFPASGGLPHSLDCGLLLQSSKPATADRVSHHVSLTPSPASLPLLRSPYDIKPTGYSRITPYLKSADEYLNSIHNLIPPCHGKSQFPESRMRTSLQEEGGDYCAYYSQFTGFISKKKHFGPWEWRLQEALPPISYITSLTMK